MYLHRGQYYFSCGPQGTHGERHEARTRVFFSRVLDLLLHPLTALNHAAHLAVAASVDGVRFGVRRVIRAIAARLKSDM